MARAGRARVGCRFWATVDYHGGHDELGADGCGRTAAARIGGGVAAGGGGAVRGGVHAAAGAGGAGGGRRRTAGLAAAARRRLHLRALCAAGGARQAVAVEHRRAIDRGVLGAVALAAGAAALALPRAGGVVAVVAVAGSREPLGAGAGGGAGAAGGAAAGAMAAGLRPLPGVVGADRLRRGGGDGERGQRGAAGAGRRAVDGEPGWALRRGAGAALGAGVGAGGNRAAAAGAARERGADAAGGAGAAGVRRSLDWRRWRGPESGRCQGPRIAGGRL